MVDLLFLMLLWSTVEQVLHLLGAGDTLIRLACATASCLCLQLVHFRQSSNPPSADSHPTEHPTEHPNFQPNYHPQSPCQSPRQSSPNHHANHPPISPQSLEILVHALWMYLFISPRFTSQPPASLISFSWFPGCIFIWHIQYEYTVATIISYSNYSEVHATMRVIDRAALYSTRRVVL